MKKFTLVFLTVWLFSQVLCNIKYERFEHVLTNENNVAMKRSCADGRVVEVVYDSIVSNAEFCKRQCMTGRSRVPNLCRCFARQYGIMKQGDVKAVELTYRCFERLCEINFASSFIYEQGMCLTGTENRVNGTVFDEWFLDNSLVNFIRNIGSYLDITIGSKEVNSEEENERIISAAMLIDWAMEVGKRHWYNYDVFYSTIYLVVYGVLSAFDFSILSIIGLIVSVAFLYVANSSILVVSVVGVFTMYSLSGTKIEREKHKGYIWMSFLFNVVFIFVMIYLNYYFSILLVLMLLIYLVTLISRMNASRDIRETAMIIVCFLMVISGCWNALVIKDFGKSYSGRVVSLFVEMMDLVISYNSCFSSSVRMVIRFLSVMTLPVFPKGLDIFGWRIIGFLVLMVFLVIRIKVYIMLLTRDLDIYNRSYLGKSTIMRQYLEFVSSFRNLWFLFSKMFKDIYTLSVSDFVSDIIRIWLFIIVVWYHLDIFIVSGVLYLIDLVFFGNRFLASYENLKIGGLTKEEIDTIMRMTCQVRSLVDSTIVQGCGSLIGNILRTVEHVMAGERYEIDGIPVKLTHKKTYDVDDEEGFLPDKIVEFTSNHSGTKLEKIDVGWKTTYKDLDLEVFTYMPQSQRIAMTNKYEIVGDYIRYKLATEPGDSGTPIFVKEVGRKGARLKLVGYHSQGDMDKEGRSAGLLWRTYEEDKDKHGNGHEKSTYGIGYEMYEKMVKKKDKTSTPINFVPSSTSDSSKKLVEQKLVTLYNNFAKSTGIKLDFKFNDKFKKLLIGEGSLTKDMTDESNVSAFLKELVRENKLKVDLKALTGTVTERLKELNRLLV